MLAVLVALAGLSLVVLIGGFVALLATRGAVEKRVGPEAGAEVMGSTMEEEQPGEVTLAEGSLEAFKGTGAKVEVEAEISLGEIRRALRSGDRRTAVPGILVLGGMMGLLFFGGLALFVGLEHKIVGGLAAAAGVVAAIRMGWSFARSPEQQAGE